MESKKKIIAFVFAYFCFSCFGNSTQEIQDKVRADLLGKEDPLDYTIHRTIRRLGNKTMELETFMSFEGDYRLTRNIFGEWKKVERWALHRINERPNGGTYFVQVMGFSPDEVELDLLHGHFFFDFPVFKKKMDRAFIVRLKKDEESVTLQGKALPNPASPIGAAEGFLTLMRGEGLPNHVWAYLEGKVQFKNPLLYELLPKTLIERESVERMRILLDNYRVEEGRRRGVAGH